MVSDSQTPCSNPYQSPETPADTSIRSAAAYRDCSLIMLVLNLLLTLFVTYNIVRTRHAFSQMLYEFECDTPLALIVVSHWYAWVLPLLAFVGIAKEAALKNRRVTLIWNGAGLAVGIVIWQLYLAGVFGEIVRLTNWSTT